MLKWFLTFQTNLLTFIYKRWFIKIRKKSILNCRFIVRDDLELIVHYLMDFFVLILYPRLIKIYQIYSYLIEHY
ncbi:hypothetical protein AHAS_Ahas02G0185200 [Arachis hypogaea]